MTSSAITADPVLENWTTHANPNGTVAPETIATAISDSPAGLLEQARVALDNGDIQQFALRAHQAADGAMLNAARRLGYSTDTQADVHSFILALEGAPPSPPPGADTATLNAWMDAYIQIPPTYWAPYAVVDRLRTIAHLPDKSLLESDDPDLDADRHEIRLLIISEFIDAIATAPLPEPAP